MRTAIRDTAADATLQTAANDDRESEWLAAAIALRRHRRWARTAAYAIIGWFALVPAAVAAMAVVMQLRDDPNATTAATILFVVAATVFTFGADWLYRPMFTSASTEHLRQARIDTSTDVHRSPTHHRSAIQ